MVETDFDKKIVEDGVVQPLPEPSTSGHVKSYGGEMRTWAPQGALTGAVIGFIIGCTLYLLVSRMAAFDEVRMNAPIVLPTVILLLATLVGAGGGAVVGIGTPRFNPHPAQGWVKDWQTFILRRQNHQKYIYVPRFKNPQREGRRQNQRG